MILLQRLLQMPDSMDFPNVSVMLYTIPSRVDDSLPCRPYSLILIYQNLTCFPNNGFGTDLGKKYLHYFCKQCHHKPVPKQFQNRHLELAIGVFVHLNNT